VPGVEIQNAAGLVHQLGIAGEDPTPCCHGRMASS
jgi:hypothetical protein